MGFSREFGGQNGAAGGASTPSSGDATTVANDAAKVASGAAVGDLLYQTDNAHTYIRVTDSTPDVSSDFRDITALPTYGKVLAVRANLP